MGRKDKPLVLSVDDVPENIDVVKGILTPDYAVSAAINGPLALKIAASQQPDLILLDVMMPEMDGHEVCRRLKQDEVTRDIPVIFVTALGEEKSELEGLKLGAVDYVTKPISPQILKARISAHIRLVQMQKELDHKNRLLEDERRLMEDLVLRMRHDNHFDNRFIEMLNIPVEKTSGDIVLSAFRADGGQHVLVGDFTGHGLPAAIGGPLVSNVFYSMSERGCSGVEVLQEVNRVLQAQLPTNIFMAACMVEVSPSRETLRVWNAGLPDALILRSGDEWEKSESILPPLGIMGELDDVEGQQIELSSGDHFFTYTDGLTEAENEKEELFGVERLKEALLKHASADNRLQKLQEEVAAFVGGSANRDDLTLIDLAAG